MQVPQFEENKWSFTLEEIEPANAEKCECAVYQYWLRRNGCVFLMTDNITAIPHIATEVKLQSLCDLLNINNFNEMDATCSGDNELITKYVNNKFYGNHKETHERKH